MIHKAIWVGVFLGMLLPSAWAAADETQVMYLSGRGKDDPVTWDFFCTGGRNSGEWTTIGVPSNWELQGFGGYNYGHDRPKHNEQGKYRRKFTVPDDWSGKRIFIVFEGVMTDAEVRVNGKSAGPKHQGGFYRFKYEITDLIEPGENLLEVDVSKVSSDASVEQAERQGDYWVFGGIYRPVYLEAVPEQFIEWVAVDAKADGSFRLDAHLNRIGTADAVKATVIGRNGNPVGGMPGGSVAIERGQAKASVSGKVVGVEPWTAETPYLYDVKIDLMRGTEIVHTVTQTFGFRTFEVRPGDGLYLNGQKIRLKGVCRHSFWPDSGRCLSPEISYDDVRLIKSMNMNAVRMSHYPPDPHFLQVCDELGLYVLDELAGWQKPPYDTGIGKKLVKEMVTRDVCHPCILFWDNGNEGGWNRELDDQFALYDPQNRTVLHPWENIHGVDTDHYETYASTLKKLNSSTLFMPTEFLHGLYDGGHGAGLNDYWNATLASPMGAGGFLWALVDEGVVRTDRDGQIDTDGNHAPDGIVGPYRQKEGSYYTIKEIYSPVQIAPEKLPVEFNGRLEVENRYDFTNLSACRFEVQLAEFPGPGDDGDGHKAFFRQTFDGPDVAPHGKGWLDLELPGNWAEAEVLYVTAFDPEGDEVWTWSWPVREKGHYRDKYVATEAEEAPQVTISGAMDKIHVEAGRLVLAFTGSSGELASVTLAGEPIAFRGGPALIGGTAEPAKLSFSQIGNGVILNVTYAGDIDSVRWHIYPTGWVRLDYQYQLNGPMSAFGLGFNYPRDRVKGVRWLGRGPYRVWKNRMKGGVLDVYRNTNKDHTPGVTWDFPEFAGYYRDWNWAVLDTDQGPITLVNATDDLFLGLYRPNDGADPRTTKLDAPETEIAFLHGIPAIGTKFHKAESLGPESQKNVASGRYRGAVWLYFGDLGTQRKSANVRRHTARD